MGIKQKEKLSFQTARNGNAVDNNTKVKNHEIVRAKIGAEAELSFIEKFVYFCVYSYFLATAVYKIFLFPLEEPEKLYSEDFDDGWTFLGRKRDTSDFEWQFWAGQFRNLVIASSLHSFGNRLVSWLYPQHRMLFFAMFQLGFLSISIGWKPTLVFVAHNVLYYIAGRTRSTLFCWFVGLALLVSFISVDRLMHLQFYAFSKDTNEGDFVLFTSLMCQLRGMSFCLDCCLSGAKKDKGDANGNEDKDEVKYGFIDLLGYNFYLPLFCNGPVVLYDEFYKQVNKPPRPLSKEVRASFLWDAIRTLFWFTVMELGSHVLYINSLARDPYLIENVPVLMSTGLVYILLLLFSIKYVVFYRIAGMYSRLDGISPPDIPKCVLNIYSFPVMWKTFDKGLHHWLMKYIYKPLGGSKHGIFRQLISSMATFAYVYYWHGAYDYLLYWAVSQWLGVFIEAMAAKLLKTKTLQHLEYDILSPSATRRLHAMGGVFTIIAGILSNCAFLVGHQSVLAYLKAVFIKGGVWTPLCLAMVTYCLVQVIMEVELRTREDKNSKKKL
ncbi:Hypothetical predicted protein [Paramuricea clavata]|uniref:Uncharacterized protein n=2 Tax=Paramuricea clavata TaxID=317549 RepID=A0A6S7FBM2_PARCT|nr:Hypothetical predicted protein [Paramuricea clavata]